jgi:hypothetical protein
MARLSALVVSSVLTICAALAGCGGAPPEIKVSFPGDDGGSTFELVNASGQDWQSVSAVIREMRPDGIEAECAAEQIAVWSAGDAQTFPRCQGEKTLVTIETGGQKAFFVLAEGKLYQKFGRREILLH